jgi:hypothetical protein
VQERRPGLALVGGDAGRANQAWPKIKNLTAADIQALMDSRGSVLLEFALGDEASYVFAVTPTSIASCLSSTNILCRREESPSTRIDRCSAGARPRSLQHLYCRPRGVLVGITHERRIRRRDGVSFEDADEQPVRR